MRGKLFIPGHIRSPHHTSPPKIVILSLVLFISEVYNFGWYIRDSIKIIYSSKNFDIGDLRSGQFGDFSILRQWEKIELLFSGQIYSNIAMQVIMTY